MKTTALAIVALACLIGAFLAYGPGWQGGLLALALVFLAVCIGLLSGAEDWDHVAAYKRRIAANGYGQRWGKR